ncbi:hypothetical protein ANN_27215 [Periplaneta americana]|uniref:Mos1 transposase HTH domain-containing protein n=1 Tax=Periplaneta americana TaxID=6978 RepID=A0ABQ8RXE5_PERAM|nr:hypothetical protein ANN_27215 [Periplaneta americana]
MVLLTAHDIIGANFIAATAAARPCHEGLVETCGETALPYTTVARWVRVFNEGRESLANVTRPGRPSVSDEQVQAVAVLLDTDRSQTIRLSHTTVLHILKNRLRMRKIASLWVPHDLMEAQLWIRYNAALPHLERYGRDGDTVLRRIITFDKTWARLYEPLLKRQSNK